MPVMKWNFNRLIYMIAQILMNKFDCFIVIEGNRGLGKSTLAYHTARRISKFMKNLGKIKEYRFIPKFCLLYKRMDVIRFVNKRRSTGIADEMINVTFNRDFYDEDQKDLIKMINMNRDYGNLFIACVPQFQSLDNQIKNLCKIRITIIRRGLAILQTPTRSIYSRDKWDQVVNEKIEREWIQKKIKKPQYSKLTTFRGFFKFLPLTEKQEKIYQNIKDEKRNQILKEKGLELEEEDLIGKTVKMLEEGKIKNMSILHGIAVGNDRKPDAFCQGISRRLKEAGKNHILTSYFWEKHQKSKQGEQVIDVGGKHFLRDVIQRARL